MLDLEASVLVAEVYSRATSAEDGILTAAYIIGDGFTAAEAEKAMNFFAHQPDLIVDSSALVDDAGADFPALVVIRWTDETPSLLMTYNNYGILREIPSNEAVRHDGLDLWFMVDALASGGEVPEAAPLPPYNARELRQKIYAIRASIEEDREPWLRDEVALLRTITDGNPEGCETLVARADDMEAALEGRIDVGQKFSVILSTRIERAVQTGAITDWVAALGKEVVIAHGLDALQAARVHALVKEEPEAYISKGQLVSDKTMRERVRDVFVIRDSAMSWIATDLHGRRNSAAYQRLIQKLSHHDHDQAVVTRQAQGR
jgi:hypothetical protein